ncbi:unnamed protein product, partial [Meganyctiphanes norvegica]
MEALLLKIRRDIDLAYAVSLDEPLASLERELTPVLAQLMTLPPRNDHHPDVVWLYKWLAHPERSVEEFKHVVGKLQENVRLVMTRQFERYTENGCGGNSFYVARAGLEALASRCPVLEGPWEQVTKDILSVYDYTKSGGWYGPGSNKLNDWIIRIVADSALCPNPELRLQLLDLYNKLLKINKGNRKRALESLMSAFSFLDRGKEWNRWTMFSFPYTGDISDIIIEFSDDDYLQQYSLKIAK